MNIKIILFFIITYIIVSNDCSKLNTKLKNVKWRCETICAGSGGKAEFNTETEKCKCLLDENIDDLDMEVIKKNAQILGVPLETNKLIKIISKRNVDNKDAAIEKIIDITETSTNTTKVENEKPEEIVGQRKKTPTRKLVSQNHPHRRNELRPISPDQQKKIMQQIRSHLSRLNQNQDQKIRQQEIDSMRILLKQLSQSVVIQDAQIRSRMSNDRIKNIVEHARQRQNRLRLSPRVGNTQMQIDSESEKHINTTVNQPIVTDKIKNKNTQFDIITQNPTLIDE